MAALTFGLMTFASAYTLTPTDQIVVDIVIDKLDEIISETPSAEVILLDALSIYAETNRETKPRISEIITQVVLQYSIEDTIVETPEDETPVNETPIEEETPTTAHPALATAGLKANTLYLAVDTFNGYETDVILMTHKNDFVMLDHRKSGKISTLPYVSWPITDSSFDGLSSLREIIDFEDKKVNVETFLINASQYFYIFANENNGDGTDTLHLIEFNKGANRVEVNLQFEADGLTYFPYYREKEFIAAVWVPIWSSIRGDVFDTYVFDLEDITMQSIGPAAVANAVDGDFDTYLEIDLSGSRDEYSYKAYSLDTPETCTDNAADCIDGERMEFKIDPTFTKGDID